MMNRATIFFIGLAFIQFQIMGQNVGISENGATPDNTSMLDVSSTNSGFLLPRMTETERDAISTPANSLMIFNTTSDCLQIYINGQWMSMQCACDPPSAPVATSATSVTGTSFDANWNASSGATKYYLDVDDDADFSSPVTGYNNLDVGNVTTYSVTGLACGTDHYYRLRAESSCGTSGNSNNISVTAGSSFITATGGTITTDGNFKVHTFTSSGTFEVTSCSGTVEYLVVAGGGGGGGGTGNAAGGGGGAGGYRTATGYAVSVNSYTVTVGGGGAGGIGINNGVNGSNSVFDAITAAGGGAGRHGNANPGTEPGFSGGSGAGGAGANSGGAGNTPATTPSQGNNGGNGVSGAAGGGGGGAGAVGGNGSGHNGGAGGAGSSSSITGSAVTYAGGGGGGRNHNGNSGGAGGAGGGGAGGGAVGVAGTANTGGGGGGSPGGVGLGSGVGGNGGSGVVIIRYQFQ